MTRGAKREGSGHKPKPRTIALRQSQAEKVQDAE